MIGLGGQLANNKYWDESLNENVSGISSLLISPADQQRSIREIDTFDSTIGVT